MKPLFLVLGGVVVALCALVVASAATDWPSTTSTATVETAAPADTVWEVLVDFPAYGEWNPFVTSAAGVAREGDDVELTLEPPGSAPQEVTAEIVIVRPVRKLRWQARRLAPGIQDREYEFLLDVARPGVVSLTGSARIEGVLVPFSSLDGVDEGLERMLAALVDRAEALAAQS